MKSRGFGERFRAFLAQRWLARFAVLGVSLLVGVATDLFFQNTPLLLKANLTVYTVIQERLGQMEKRTERLILIDLSSVPDIEQRVLQLHQKTHYGRQRLAQQGIHLSPHTIRHILRRHAPTTSRPRKQRCRFYPAYWAWESQEPFTLIQADVKDIYDKGPLGTERWDHLRKRRLPRYQWTFLERSTRAQTVIRKESPQGYIEVYENAAINWSEGVLTATGVGLMPRDEPNRARAYLKARGYARLDALANLLMLIDRVQIDAQFTGADYMMQSEVIRASVTGFVRGAQVIDERKILIEGQEAVQVTVGTAMYGKDGLSHMLLRPSPAPAEPAPAEPEPPLPRIELLVPNVPAPDAPVVEGNYTGLIIDARGLKVQPAMAPRILKADGTPIYGTGNFDLDKVVEQGLASYYRDMEAARADKRAGNNPLVLRPIGVYRRSVATTDVVLSDADAAKLLAEDAKTRFLKQLKVVFVVD